MTRRIIIYIILSTFMASCSMKSEPVEEETQVAASETSIQEQATEVQVQPATQGTFIIQKIVNGKIEADRKATVKVESTGLINEYHLVEGKYVTQGDVLIRIDDADLQLQLEQARNELDDAIMAKNERLISDGGEMNNDASVSPQKLIYINTLSGFNKANTRIKEVEYLLSRKTITAPISGWITDLKINDKEYITTGQEVCTIVDPSSFEIRIDLIENEALTTPTGTTVTAHPLLNPNQQIKATINKVNPVVGESGLVTLWARVHKTRHKIYEGMNMRVELEQKIPSQVIVPKTALVSRSGRDVIFIYDPESGLAKWKYVSIGYENKESLAIIDGINPGDQVIVEGNLNLDHDAVVLVSSQ